MDIENKYDLAVIGAGPGGYVAAIRAAQLGKKVIIIEKDKPGGVCLNIGCIPSKSLIDQASKVDIIPDLKKMGFKIDESEFSYEKIFKTSRKAALKLSKGVEFLLKKNNITYINDTAILNTKNSIKISNDKIINAENIIIATGSHPTEIPNFKFDQNLIMSSTEALMLEKLPKRIAIIGSGAIGIEFAYIYSSLNVEVHIIELMDQLLPTEDEDVVEVLNTMFKRKKIKTYISSQASIKEIKNKEVVTIEITNRENEKITIEVDKILVAVGRTPNTTNIGLENIGIKLDKKFIPVNDYYQTEVSGVFAIGDVIDSPQLAHVASKEGEIVAEHIAGINTEKEIDYNLIPFAVYSEPQVASFGKKEKQLIKEGIEYKKSIFPYRGCGKAVAVEKSDGFVKIISDVKTKEIISATIIGHEATELLHEILLAKKSELLPEDIATMIHAHPTLSESVMEVMRGVDDWTIHM